MSLVGLAAGICSLVKKLKREMAAAYSRRGGCIDLCGSTKSKDSLTRSGAVFSIKEATLTLSTVTVKLHPAATRDAVVSSDLLP